MTAPAPSGPGLTSELIPPGRWTIDPDHSSVGFIVRYLGITKLRGRFADVSGSLAATPGVLTGTATIVANSFDTDNEARDKHVKGPDFLNVDVFPRLVFTITGVKPNSGDFIINGELDLHGETHPLELHAVNGGTAKDPYGHDRVGVAMTSTILRSDFGITFDPTGSLVSDAVTLEIDLSLVRQPAYLRDAERRHEDITQ